MAKAKGFTAVGRLRPLSNCAVAWEIGGTSDLRNNNYRLKSPEFEIPALKSMCMFRLIGTDFNVYLHIVGLPEATVLNDIEVSFVKVERNEMIAQFYAQKPGNLSSLQIVSLTKNVIRVILKNVERLEIHCNLNISSNVDPHMSEALRQFESLLDNADFSDIKFVVGAKTLHAHKNILAVRSPAFFAMLNAGSVIHIEDMSYNVVKTVLRYIYCGKLRGVNNMAKELLVAANKYDLLMLKNACEEQLCNSLTVGNAIEYLNLANSHKIEKLKAAAISFIVENGKNIANGSDLDNLRNLDKKVVAEVFRNLILHYEKK